MYITGFVLIINTVQLYWKWIGPVNYNRC